MKVGLTYDLRSWYLDRGYSMEDTAEFDKQETVDAIETALRNMGLETEPVGNSFQLIEALASGVFLAGFGVRYLGHGNDV